ncbi:MAG TPA: hypothetical protein VH593_21050 [Ktedonobacteraceae bacterium]
MNGFTALCAICGTTFEARHSYGLCPACWSRDRLREWDRLETARRYALRNHLPATLTLTQWLSVCSDFGGSCAYCHEMSYQRIDMVIPERGLAYDNVVPICLACLHHKEHGFEAAIQHVRGYLACDRVAQLPLDTAPEEVIEAT